MNFSWIHRAILCVCIINKYKKPALAPLLRTLNIQKFPFFRRRQLKWRMLEKFSNFPLESVPRFVSHFMYVHLLSYSLSEGWTIWRETKTTREKEIETVCKKYFLSCSHSWAKKKRIFSTFFRLAKWFTTMPWMIQIHRLIERENNNNNNNTKAQTQSSRLTAI